MLCFLLFDKRYIAVIHKLSIKLASYRLDRKINVNTQCRCDSMLKKSIVIILIIILIGIGIFSVMHLFSSSTDSNGDTPISNEKKEPDKDNHNESDNEDVNENDNENEDDKPISKKVSDFISDTFQNAVDYFSNTETDVVAIGDSLTQGVGDETDNGGYVGIIDDIVNENKQVVTFENFGKRGNRSDQMLERMEYPDIDDALKDADIILMTIGANDIMKILRDNITDLQIEAFKDERINYEKRLRDIFDGMVDRNDQADIYLIGFYNPFKQFIPVRELDTIVDEWNKTGEDLAEEYDQIEFIPTKDLFDEADDDELLSDDSFHPNLEGYQLMAKRILEYVADEN